MTTVEISTLESDRVGRSWSNTVTFDPLAYEDAGDLRDVAKVSARADRDALLRDLRKRYPEFEFRGTCLRGQLQKYRSFGVPDGRVRTVYYIDARRR